MADEEAEEKKETPEEEEGKKKGGLMSILIFVTVGAVLGGAGVVMLMPSAKQESHSGERVPEYELVEHEEVMKFLVNPQSERGGVTARIGFRFVYKMDKHKRKEVEKSIHDFWNQAFSRCLVVISSHEAKFLATAEGKQALRKTLVDELTLTLFPSSHAFPDGVALIDDILWTEYFLQ